MADVWSGQVGNSWCPQIHLVVSLAAGTDGYDDLNWYADYVAHGYAAYTNGYARNWSINIDGQTRGGSLNINGITGSVRLGSGTIRVNKAYAYRNIGVSCSMVMDFTWNGAYLGTASGSGTHPIGQKTSYIVSYNANGGSGAPGNQTKWFGENLTLSTGKPTRTGHNFSGWATSASGAVAYQPGATYTANADLNLFAKWTPHTYTVSYNANGGSGAPGNQTKTYGKTLKLSSTIPTRKNYNFLGWGTSAGSTTVAYKAGANYTANAAITLYAIWELAWLEPRITNLQATRCDSAGTLKEDGQYAKVTFKWATDRTVSSIKIVCNGATTTPTGTGTSGTVNVVIGNNQLDTEQSYTVNVTVTDAIGGITVQTVVAAMNYIMDISPSGSIGFGTPAPSYGILSTKRVTLQGGLGTIDLMGDNGKEQWVCVGRLSNTKDSDSTIIDIYSGSGSNSRSDQNAWIKLIIKNGWQSSLSPENAFGVTVTQYGFGHSKLKVKIMAFSHSDCDVWIRFPWAFWSGTYNVTTGGRWTPNKVIQDAEPTNGTEQTGISYHYCGDLTFDNEFYGFEIPYSGSSGNWIRTTQDGLIPYSSDRTNGKSALGTETWPFGSVWSNQLNWNGGGLRGRVIKEIWNGNAASGTTITCDHKYYNLFIAKLNDSSGRNMVLCTRSLPSKFTVYIAGVGGHSDNAIAIRIQGVLLQSISSTQLKIVKLAGLSLWGNPSGAGNSSLDDAKMIRLYGVI